MKRTAAIAGITVLVLVGVAAASIPAQHGQMTGPMMDSMMGPMMMGNYDPKPEITIKGIVEQVEQPGSEYMRGMAIRLVVKSGNETFRVHLGPASFVEKTMTFKEGDEVEVIGSKMPMMGETAFMAREVKKGDTVLKLRDANGMPLWPAMQMHGPHS
jgi:hypothetical protein